MHIQMKPKCELWGVSYWEVDPEGLRVDRAPLKRLPGPIQSAIRFTSSTGWYAELHNTTAMQLPPTPSQLHLETVDHLLMHSLRLRPFSTDHRDTLGWIFLGGRQKLTNRGVRKLHGNRWAAVYDYTSLQWSYNVGRGPVTVTGTVSYCDSNMQMSSLKIDLPSYLAKFWSVPPTRHTHMSPPALEGSTVSPHTSH